MATSCRVLKKRAMQTARKYERLTKKFAKGTNTASDQKKISALGKKFTKYEHAYRRCGDLSKLL